MNWRMGLHYPALEGLAMLLAKGMGVLCQAIAWVSRCCGEQSLFLVSILVLLGKEAALGGCVMQAGERPCVL